MSRVETSETLETGNGERLSRGVFEQADGTFLALTCPDCARKLRRAGVAISNTEEPTS